ncbi:unnamed protein product [Effrenium voratum]|nr:unnamed protein product [Effrenium voratum]
MVSRTLRVFELSRVRSLQQQLLASSRKRKLAEGLYVEEDESSTLAVVAPEAETYLQQLFMLYPWMSCSPYYRARRTALMIPQSRRLGWLQQRDVEERAEWVARFRKKSTREDPGSQLMMGKPINGKQVARIMRDGTKPCAAFQ